MLPVICSVVVASVGGGVTLARIGFYSPFYIMGTSIALLGSVLLHFSKVDTSAAAIMCLASLVGFGAGLYSQVAFSVIQTKVQIHQVGQAIGLVTTFQTLGGLLSMAVAGAVFLNTATSALTGLFPGVPIKDLKNEIAGTSSAAIAQLDPATRQAALGMIVDSIDKVFIIEIVASALGLVCSLLLKYERITERPKSAKVLAVCHFVTNGQLSEDP